MKYIPLNIRLVTKVKVTNSGKHARLLTVKAESNYLCEKGNCLLTDSHLPPTLINNTTRGAEAA